MRLRDVEDEAERFSFCPLMLLAYLVGTNERHPESHQKCNPAQRYRLHCDCTLCGHTPLLDSGEGGGWSEAPEAPFAFDFGSGPEPF